MYKAIYESTIPGEALQRDKRADEERRLEFAKFLAPSNGELVRLEFGSPAGAIIWTRERGWLPRGYWETR